MSFLRALAALALALAAQTVLGHLWSGAHRFVDLMLLPVVWYGLAGSQRSGMFAGCAAGLLQDAWFQIGTFGLSGFKKTLLGWALGGIGSRFDINRQGGRFVTGSVVSLAESLLDLGLRRLMDQEPAGSGPLDIVIRAVVAGVLVAAMFGIVERSKRRRGLRRLAY